jgi:hypothetical protein
MAFAWSRVIAASVMGCVMALYAPKIYMPGISRSALSVLFRFGVPLAGANVINFILINVDYAFVGHLLGAIFLGVYMLAFTIASSPGLLLGNVINSIAMPAFSRVKHDPDLLKNAMTGALRVVSLILMPMCGLMIALARPIVLTVYGAKWEASARVLSILALYGAVSIICILFANILTSLGKAKFTLFVQLLWLVALVPAMVLGVHRNGIVGAAAAHIAVIGPLVLPCYLFALRRATGIRFTMLGKAILPPLLAGVAAALAARATASQFATPLIQLVSGLAAGGLTYLVAAGPQIAAWLTPAQAAKLRVPRLFRPGDTEHRDMGGIHRPDNAAAAGQRRSATVTSTLPSASEDAQVHHAQHEDTSTHHGQDLAVTGRLTGLLRPEARVMPFWRRPELGELLEWCRAPGQSAVRLVTGEGGAGKTRLAIELARELENDGWHAQWVPPGAEPEVIRAARRTARPTVLLVDQAETRPSTARLLIDAAGSLDGPDLRVVLLARNSGQWWQELMDSADYRLREMLAAAWPIQLGPITHAVVQRDVFEAAITRFAVLLGATRPAARLPLTDPDVVVLILHAAALSAVLDVEHAADEHPRSSADVLESLLRSEIRYCGQAAAAAGLDLDPGMQRRLIAVAWLIGADSESATAGILRRLPDFAESAWRHGQVARWLHDLYPGQAAADGGVTGWSASLPPERLVEQLIVGELTKQPALIPVLFTGLDESRAKKALTVLGRAALNYPDAVPLLAQALAADLEHLAIPALAVAVETNPVLDRLIADTITAQALPTQALERIAAAIPRRSRGLAATAATVFQRLASAGSDHAGPVGPFRRIGA